MPYIRLPNGTWKKVNDGAPVDSTLKISGAAADAKAVGEALIGVVHHDSTQDLTDLQKKQARFNIGAVSEEDVGVALAKTDEAIAELNDEIGTKLVAPESATVGQFIKVLGVDDAGNVIATETADLAQTDWNQNDETAVDFIKNKPFGEDYWDTVATITGTGNSDGSLTFEMTEPEWQSAICNIGTVIVYDENNYEIAEESVGTGNYFTLTGEGIMISGRGVGAGFNWTLHLDNVSFTEGEEYAFSVLQYVELKQIDEKYIPDTIMRTPSDDQIIDMLIEEELLPAVSTKSGAILTDKNGNVILRY